MTEDRLQARIKAETIAAMKAGDKATVSTLRFLSAEIKNVAIEKRRELTDEDILEVIGRQARRRLDSIEQFKAGGREDLVQKETFELQLLRAYLPAELSSEELSAIVKEAIRSTGAAGVRDMGKVMAAVMPRTKGRADGKIVSQVVKEGLA